MGERAHGANVGGGGALRKECLREGMDVYDALPAALRRALADAPLNFSPIALLEIYLAHGERIALASLAEAIRRTSGGIG